MTEGYVTDVNGDDTVMDEPHATIEVDAQHLDRQQAITLAQEGEIDESQEYALGALVAGNDDVTPEHLGTITFHLHSRAALVALVGAGVLEQQQPQAPQMGGGEGGDE